MYEIYINERPLFLMNSKDILGRVMDQNHFIARYTGKVKNVMNFIDMMEKSPKFNSVTLHYPDLDLLWADFQTQFKMIEAAGGLVRNEAGKTLVIYRLGTWDLPKGKIEKGESVTDAAVREVQEETGIQAIELGAELIQTYHTYRNPHNSKHERILKRTYWFDMKTSKTTLVPQAEENIEKAEWVDLEHFIKNENNIYDNIKLVMEAGV